MRHYSPPILLVSYKVNDPYLVASLAYIYINWKSYNYKGVLA